MMNHSPLRSMAIALCLLVTPVFVSCSEEEVVATEVTRGVIVQTVAAPGGEYVRVLSGVARSARTTDLSFRVQGQIVSLPVKTGDLVEAGALVAELDRTDFGIDLQEARASLTQARAELRNAEASYRRARALYEREGISRTDLDSARAAAESGRASVQASEQRVRAGERTLGFTRLVTPSGGAISVVPVELRENVTAGQVVAVLQTGGAPEIEVPFPEVLISQVETGDAVDALFEAFPGETYKGTVRKVGVAPGDDSSTYPVTVSLDTNWKRIRPGMAAEVSFRFPSESEVVVPASAVGEDLDGRYVYLVDPEAGDEGFGTTRRVSVRIGQVVESGFTIDEGLSGGERLVTAGVPRVSDGMRVRLLDASNWP